ncbi:KH domain-containing protein, partial [Salmonella sp. s51228]|uniref:KH domain-containing protein n=1 Tax=Salmonella sp. s51228 TaxID=3159652 RepID=UPI00397F81AF
GLGGSVYILDDRDPRNMVLGIMEQYVGGLVGKKGQTISDIQQASGASIQISHKEEYIPGTRDRKVNISGEPSYVHAAYVLICNKVKGFSLRGERS